MPDYHDSHVGEGRGGVYDARYRLGAEAFYWENFEQPYLTELFPHLAKTHPGRFLDVACGTGRILHLAAPCFSESIGIDISQDMLKEAQGKCPNSQLLQMDISSATEDIGMFSVISLFRFLLNSEPQLREDALCWIRSILATNGVLVVNNHMNASSCIGVLLRLRNLQLGYRRHNILAESEIKTLLARHGFRIKESFGFALIPSLRNRMWLPPKILLAIERRLRVIPGFQRWCKDRIYICSPI